MNFSAEIHVFRLLGQSHIIAMRGVEGCAVRGGNIYWGRKHDTDFKGIVVVFAWVSVPQNLLQEFVDLYSSLGWNSLVCYAHYLSA